MILTLKGSDQIRLFMILFHFMACVNYPFDLDNFSFLVWHFIFKFWHDCSFDFVRLISMPIIFCTCSKETLKQRNKFNVYNISYQMGYMGSIRVQCCLTIWGDSFCSPVCFWPAECKCPPYLLQLLYPCILRRHFFSFCQRFKWQSPL